jgi:HSP20 family molecular chaperone IbpA
MQNLHNMKKLSFFERLTGTMRMDDDLIDSSETDTESSLHHTRSRLTSLQQMEDIDTEYDDEQVIAGIEAEEADAELAVDVFHTDRDITIQTMTAGIKKEHLEIILSRAEITIRGKRDNPNDNYNNEFVIQELYWGPFARTIELPDEVAIDEAVATEHHGLLTIKLPKFNKTRSIKLKAQ